MQTPPTLYDVAREAGVSLATASRAINGSTRKVNDAYRERVLAAAAKLGYTANASAQAVARGASATVAMLVSDIADPFFSSIAAGVVRGAEEHGLAVTIAVTDRDPDKEIELVRVLRGQRPRAIVLAGSRFVDDESSELLVAELRSFAATGGRVVLVSQDELPFPTVAIDNRTGAKELAEKLVERGYRRFAILAGPERLVTARDRVSSFVGALQAAGITVDPDRIVHGGFTRDAGFEAMEWLIDNGLGDVELVFAVNDVMAIGALSALRARGIPVPDQIAVAGFDDIVTAHDVTPALTTVRIPLEHVGERAVELALDSVEPHGPAIVVPVEVVLRESTPGR